MLLCETIFLSFFVAGVASLCWFCREPCVFMLVCRQSPGAWCFTTDQRFVFITEILKVLPKNEGSCARNSRLASRERDPQESLASHFDDKTRTLEHPSGLRGAFDRRGVRAASVHHLCKYDGLLRLKMCFVESNGALKLSSFFFVGAVCSRPAEQDGDPRLGGLSRGKDWGRPRILLVQLTPSHCCRPDLLWI